ncbi:hypothetical protein V6N12_050756 [Hibiscus sabdariffa]|uniref:Uncharacterized protein n=1 Tax=Hibiscus sabdariffa TaxID=183260 RepID=A0ABR2GE67_9ROSI
MGGTMGGRPTDVGNDYWNLLENDVSMEEHLNAKKHEGSRVLADSMGSGEPHGNLNVKENVVSIPSFKETLIGSGGKSRDFHPIVELDVEVGNRRRRNFHNQGPSGRNGGITTEREARGSQFVALSNVISDEVEGEIGSLLAGEENRTRTISVADKRVFVDRALGASTIAGEVAVALHRKQVDRGKSVGGAGSIEKVAELAGGVEDDRSPRNTKGRVLPASLRGQIAKPRSKIQLGVRGSKNTTKGRKLDGRGTSEEELGGRLSTLLSELNAVAELKEEWLALPREPGNANESGVDWQTNSVFDQPGEFEMQV